jgi:hypothetical protein
MEMSGVKFAFVENPCQRPREETMKNRGFFGTLDASAWLAQWSTAADRPWRRLAAVVMILALPAAGQEGASQIQAEVGRLQQALKDSPASYQNLPNADAMITSCRRHLWVATRQECDAA